MVPNYGAASCESPLSPTCPLQPPACPLVMPSLRTLVSSSSSRRASPRPQDMGATPSLQQDASTSAGAGPGVAAAEETCARLLVAPRPPLASLVSSPKRPMKRDASCGSLLFGLRPTLSSRTASGANMRKCETVLALSSLEPLKPVNRLRGSSSSRGGLVCSRCSSLLSMASTSRFSLNTVLEMGAPPSPPTHLCKLCLSEVARPSTFQLQQCGCIFCMDCMSAYVEFEVTEGAYDISCPDAQCEAQGVLALTEIEGLVTAELMERHRKYRLNHEVDQDAARLWCPRAGCETVCRVCPSGERCSPQGVHCPTCETHFCSNCKQPWHAGRPCEDPRTKVKLLSPFDPERIKCCPMCSVPIEKDEGCAQMMCKRCKHVFCWYCLASLDDDFLLRHYDKGPCKNKLGHSRASVIWHRTQVIAIFAGFGVLLLVASPLLLLAAPCIVCCKCRACSEQLDDDPETSTTNAPTLGLPSSSST